MDKFTKPFNNSNSSLVIIQDYDEKFYLVIGSTWVYDSIYLFFISPWYLINVLMNLFSYYVLTRIKLNRKTRKFYIYLKIYVLDCALMSLIGSTLFVSYSSRYFRFSLSFVARIFRCQIYNSVVTLLYYYSNILDILITIERLSQFMLRPNTSFNKSSPYKACFVAFIFCLILNSPAFLWNDIISDYEFYNGARDLANIESFSYCGRSEFIKSNFGSISSLLMIIIRDFLTVIFEIILNIYSIYYYRKFLQRKNQLVHHGQIASVVLDHDRGGQNNHHAKEHERLTTSDVNLFLMTIYLSLVSVFFHSFTGISFFFVIYFKSNYFLTYSFFLSCLVFSCVKFFFNLIVFYLFNNKFRKEFKMIFGLKEESN